MTSSLRHSVGKETAEIVDLIMGQVLSKCIGKNDMTVANGLLVSAAILVAAHCQRTGDNFEEIAGLCRKSFDLAVKVSRERKP